MKEAALTLGYTQKKWDKGKTPKECDVDWEELTPEKKNAAMKLGYDEELWDEED